ncbi:MAG TPA: hypothetical protein VME46_24975 [Acidimicrobiales bacterium]|nr:hypothetical protein [Acidimicrobiales bacterium]
MGVRQDCRHYLRRTTHGGEVMQRCRLGMAEEADFACPDGCLFFEGRVLSTAGWATEGEQNLANTAWGLAGLQPPKGAPPNRTGRGRKKGRRDR